MSSLGISLTSVESARLFSKRDLGPKVKQLTNQQHEKECSLAVLCCDGVEKSIEMIFLTLYERLTRFQPS